MIQQNLTEHIFETLTEPEINSFEKFYDYLNLKLPHSMNYDDLYNLYYSLFCSLDILPESLKSLKLTKEVLALTFVKLSTEKNITKLLLINHIQDKKYWIEQITICMRADKWPNHENASILLVTN